MFERLLPSRLRGGIASVALARAEQAVAVKVAIVVAPFVAAGLLLLLLLAFLAGGAGAGCGESAGRQLVGEAAVSALGMRAIPRRFIPIYVDAARRYRLGPRGWSILASVHKNENGFSGSGGSPTSTAGALGPMQFLSSTWAAYGADGDGDGRKDVQNVHDAIHGAARYLRALGAPGDWRSAIFGYNHADWYVALVVDWATKFAGGTPTRFASTTNSGGGGACGCATTTASTGGPSGPLPAGAPDLSWPSAQRSIISPFGPRWGRIHEGIDIPMPSGTDLNAAAAGRVVSAGWVSGYGNYTCIAHAVRFSTCYAHQTRIAVRAGQRVAAGQRIGVSGCTGSCFGPHLHFEVRLGQGISGRAVDPAGYLQGRPGPSGDTALAAAGGSACADTQLAAFDGGSLGWPTARRRGELIGFPYQGTHRLGNWQSDNAFDISVPVGTPIVAVGDGTICSGCGFGASTNDLSSRFAGARLTLALRGNQVFYTHLSRLARGIRPGVRVKRGQLLGYSGSANGVPHLHIGFEYGNPRLLLGVGAPTTAA